jgi:hypothetical protein
MQNGNTKEPSARPASTPESAAKMAELIDRLRDEDEEIA